MSIDVEIKGIRITQVEPDSHNQLTVTIEGADLPNSIDLDVIISEYGEKDVVEALGEDYVKSWLEGQGYTVTED